STACTTVFPSRRSTWSATSIRRSKRAGSWRRPKPMPLTVELVTAERVVRVERGIDALIVPGSEGQLAIYPKHAALMTTLLGGELVMRRAGVEEAFAVTGGFMEVRNDHVTILADAAEA